MNDSKPSSNFLSQADSSQKPHEVPLSNRISKNKYYKSKLCPEFTAGFCSKGNNCHYAHGMSDLRCDVFFRRNACKDGDKCCYKHIRNNRHWNVPEILPPRPSAWKTQMYFWWQKNGRCTNGERRGFAHKSAELRSQSAIEIPLPSNTSETIMSKDSLGNNQKQEEDSARTPSKIVKLPRKLVGIYGDWIDES